MLHPFNKQMPSAHFACLLVPRRHLESLPGTTASSSYISTTMTFGSREDRARQLAARHRKHRISSAGSQKGTSTADQVQQHPQPLYSYASTNQQQNVSPYVPQAMAPQPPFTQLYSQPTMVPQLPTLPSHHTSQSVYNIPAFVSQFAGYHPGVSRQIQAQRIQSEHMSNVLHMSPGFHDLSDFTAAYPSQFKSTTQQASHLATAPSLPPGGIIHNAPSAQAVATLQDNSHIQAGAVSQSYSSKLYPDLPLHRYDHQVTTAQNWYNSVQSHNPQGEAMPVIPLQETIMAMPTTEPSLSKSSSAPSLSRPKKRDYSSTFENDTTSPFQRRSNQPSAHANHSELSPIPCLNEATASRYCALATYCISYIIALLMFILFPYFHCRCFYSQLLTTSLQLLLRRWWFHSFCWRSIKP